MAAPDIPTLLDYETNLEDALTAYLVSRHATWQVLTDRTAPAAEGKLRTPRVEVAFTLTGSGTAEHQAGNRPDEPYYESEKIGTLTVSVVAQRGASGQSLGQMRGALREDMLPRTLALTSVNVPYYEILDVTETGSTPSIFADNDEIISELTWSLRFFIKPAAWPAS
jgi:hypothetical protein